MTSIATGGPLATTLTAIQARLKLILPETRFLHRIVPPHMTGASWKQLVGDGRVVGLGFAGVDPEKRNARFFSGETKWVVFLVGKNPRGIEAAYLGDALSHGVMAMAEAAAAVLHGWTIPNVGSVSVNSIQAAYAEGWDPSDNMAMLAVEFSTGYALQMGDAVTLDVPDLLRIASTWDLPGAPAVVTDVNTVSEGS